MLLIDQTRLSWFNFTYMCMHLMSIRSGKKKEIEADDEPPRSVLWIKGRQNKDGESTDAEISSVADKLVNLTANSIIMLIYQQH